MFWTRGSWSSTHRNRIPSRRSPCQAGLALVVSRIRLELPIFAKLHDAEPLSQRYAFDQVFDENADQETVFKETTKPLLDGILNGFNATVFAYGVGSEILSQHGGG